MRKARRQVLAGEEKEDDGQIDVEDTFQLEYEVLQEYDRAQKTNTTKARLHEGLCNVHIQLRISKVL